MSAKKRFVIAAVAALTLNVIWEFSHRFLYIDLSGIPENTHLIIASLADMLIISAIFGIVSLVNQGLDWIKNPGKFEYWTVVFLGLVVAVLIEVVNLNLGRWEYTPAMPTFFGVGASPLVQLALTGAISLFLARQLKEPGEKR
ncbi:MAG: hypothetical protein U5L10_02870 [Candidatus Moranbacteria bacterium]|nr:hypothetical protein [Candidatus Moranbacteria bacterium]